ncbi:MAG: prepilin-type N-terminal cleavage/methylation domain-containing protein, partial [Candidatus Omnitrophica bacterium]|nr:prepilin-type N-terminal cleavage/methylation domain-containing protein [Candidatus Omnitrophota bacterium]
MKKGFTLIELIIVVIILGILAAIGIPQYIKAIEKARGAEGYAGLGYIQSGEKLYYANNEVYYAEAPLTDVGEQVLDINLPQSGWTFAIVASVPP